MHTTTGVTVHPQEAAYPIPNVSTVIPVTGLYDKSRIPFRPTTREAANLAFEFLADIASVDGYGHSVSPEVVKRAVRILAMLRPQGHDGCGPVGYQAPPPSRCEFCDES